MSIIRGNEFTLIIVSEGDYLRRHATLTEAARAALHGISVRFATILPPKPSAPIDSPKLRDLKRRLALAKAQRNKVLIRDLEKQLCKLT